MSEYLRTIWGATGAVGQLACQIGVTATNTAVSAAAQAALSAVRPLVTGTLKWVIEPGCNRLKELKGEVRARFVADAVLKEDLVKEKLEKVLGQIVIPESYFSVDYQEDLKKTIAEGLAELEVLIPKGLWDQIVVEINLVSNPTETGQIENTLNQIKNNIYELLAKRKKSLQEIVKSAATNGVAKIAVTKGNAEIKELLLTVPNYQEKLQEGIDLEAAVEEFTEKLFRKLQSFRIKYPNLVPAFLVDFLESESPKRFLRFFLLQKVLAEKGQSGEEVLYNVTLKILKTLLDPFKEVETISDEKMEDFVTTRFVQQIYDIFRFEGTVAYLIAKFGKWKKKEEFVAFAVHLFTSYRDFLKVQKRLLQSEKYKTEVLPTSEKVFKLFDENTSILADWIKEEVKEFLNIENELLVDATKKSAAALFVEARPMIEFAVHFAFAAITSSHKEGTAKESTKEHIDFLLQTILNDLNTASEPLKEEDKNRQAIYRAYEAVLNHRRSDLMGRIPQGINSVNIETPAETLNYLVKASTPCSRQAIWLKEFVKFKEELATFQEKQRLDRQAQELFSNIPDPHLVKRDTSIADLNEALNKCSPDYYVWLKQWIDLKQKMEELSSTTFDYWINAFDSDERQGKAREALYRAIRCSASTEVSLRQLIRNLFDSIFLREESYLCEELTPFVVDSLSVFYSLLIGDTVIYRECMPQILQSAATHINRVPGTHTHFEEAKKRINSMLASIETLSKKTPLTEGVYAAIKGQVGDSDLIINLFGLLYQRECLQQGDAQDGTAAVERFWEGKDQLLLELVKNLHTGKEPKVAVDELFHGLLIPYQGEKGFVELLLPHLFHSQGRILLHSLKSQLSLRLESTKCDLAEMREPFEKEFILAEGRLKVLKGFELLDLFIKEAIAGIKKTNPFEKTQSYLNGISYGQEIFHERILYKLSIILLDRSITKSTGTFEEAAKEPILRIFSVIESEVAYLRLGGDAKRSSSILVSELMLICGGREELMKLILPQSLSLAEEWIFDLIEENIATYLKALSSESLPASEADEAVIAEFYPKLLELGLIDKEIASSNLIESSGVRSLLGAVLFRLRGLVNEKIPGLLTEPKRLLQIANRVLSETHSYICGDLHFSEEDDRQAFAGAVDRFLHSETNPLPFPEEERSNIRHGIGERIFDQLEKLTWTEEEMLKQLEGLIFGSIGEKIPCLLWIFVLPLLPAVWLIQLLLRPTVRRIAKVMARSDFPRFVRHLVRVMMTPPPNEEITEKDVDGRIQQVANQFGFIASWGFWTANWVVGVKTFTGGKALPEVVLSYLPEDRIREPVSILSYLQQSAVPPQG